MSNFSFPTPPGSGGNDHFSFDPFRFSGPSASGNGNGAGGSNSAHQLHSQGQGHHQMRDFFPHTHTHSNSPNDSTSNYLDMPGPSNYLNPTHTSLSHRSSFDEQYLQDQDDDEGDEEGELVKLEDPLGHAQGDGSGEGEGDADDQEPLYVNAKQYHRIVKRRAARARLEELNRLVRSRKVCLLLLPLPLLVLDFILNLITPLPPLL